MRYYILVAAMAVMAGSAAAQQQPGPFISKPIDTSKAVVATDAAAAVTSGATTGIFRTMTRTVAGAIENNGYVKTINNLFGKRYKAPAPQAGFSQLPQATMYHSTSYQNAFRPAMPIAATVGQTPGVIVPASPSTHR